MPKVAHIIARVDGPTKQFAALAAELCALSESDFIRTAVREKILRTVEGASVRTEAVPLAGDPLQTKGTAFDRPVVRGERLAPQPTAMSARDLLQGDQR